MIVPAPQPFPPVVELLPHDPPMLLLDEVVQCRDDTIVCVSTFHAQMPTVRNGRVSSVLALEQMAQSAAVLLGYRSRVVGQAPTIGYLLGTRELELHVDSFSLGDTVFVEARHAWGDGRLATFACEVVLRGRVVAAATVNVLSSIDDEPT